MFSDARCARDIDGRHLNAEETEKVRQRSIQGKVRVTGVFRFASHAGCREILADISLLRFSILDKRAFQRERDLLDVS